MCLVTEARRRNHRRISADTIHFWMCVYLCAAVGFFATSHWIPRHNYTFFLKETRENSETDRKTNSGRKKFVIYVIIKIFQHMNKYHQLWIRKKILCFYLRFFFFRGFKIYLANPLSFSINYWIFSRCFCPNGVDDNSNNERAFILLLLFNKWKLNRLY